MTVSFDNPPAAPAPLADRYSNVAAIDLGVATMLVLSGQVALGHDGSIAGTDMTSQSEHIFRNVGAMLAAYGGGFQHVVNIRTYLTATPPTSTTIEVSGLFRPEALLEVEITAVLPK